MSGRWSFPAELSCIPVARRVVADYAAANGVPEPPLEALKLALTEAVTNAVVHAYHSIGPGEFTVTIVVKPHRSVMVIVIDDGVGMQPRLDSPGLGLGLALISSLTTSAQVRTPASGRGTEVRMSFALAG
jgi:anti-sigma regulatory factor (Ser/Thr protein kinase)